MKCNEMRRRVIGLKSAPVISKIHLRSHNMKEEDGGGEYLATDTISNATVPKLSGKHICAWKRYFRLSGTHCPKDSKHTKHILCLCGAGIKGYLTCNIFLDSFLLLHSSLDWSFHFGFWLPLFYYISANFTETERSLGGKLRRILNLTDYVIVVWQRRKVTDQNVKPCTVSLSGTPSTSTRTSVT